MKEYQVALQTLLIFACCSTTLAGKCFTLIEQMEAGPIPAMTASGDEEQNFPTINHKGLGGKSALLMEQYISLTTFNSIL